MPRPSLFVVALPRSLSSLLYHAVRGALGLSEPDWTTDGEVLNVDRFALAGARTVAGPAYLERRRDGRRFDRSLHFLDRVTRAEGFAYKDVTQPFVMSRWLPTSRVRVLRLDRPVPDVAYSMLRRRWLYPARAAGHLGEATAVNLQREQPDLERSMVRGLLHARRALDEVGGARVLYDDLVQDEAPIWDALRSLYGDDVPRPAYLGSAFRRRRAEVLGRRDTELHRRLAALCQQLEGEESPRLESDQPSCCSSARASARSAVSRPSVKEP